MTIRIVLKCAFNVWWGICRRCEFFKLHYGYLFSRWFFGSRGEWVIFGRTVFLGTNGSCFDFAVLKIGFEIWIGWGLFEVFFPLGWTGESFFISNFLLGMRFESICGNFPSNWGWEVDNRKYPNQLICIPFECVCVDCTSSDWTYI